MFTRINESDYIIILDELGEQEIILFLFNESKDPSSNNEIIEISIPSINLDRDEYESFSIFIYYCPDLLALIKMDNQILTKNSSISNNDLNIPECITIS
jgi:hypothetical protein